MGIGHKFRSLAKMAAGQVKIADNFYANSPERQEWLIKTGCRYIWENPEIISARARLYQHIGMQGTDAAGIVESSIEGAMDRYFYNFNLAGLNSLL